MSGKRYSNADWGKQLQVANSGKLISAAEDCIEAVTNGRRGAFDAALEQLYSAYQAINQSMETMWGRSKPADYIKFRFEKILFLIVSILRSTLGRLSSALLPKRPVLNIIMIWIF